MVEIIPERRGPSTAERFTSAIGKGLEQGQKLYQQHQQNQSLQRLTGKDFSGLSAEFQKIFAEKMAKSPDHDRMVKAFESYGFSPEEAEFYSILTQGGQTAVVKDLLEGRKRAGGFSNKLQDNAVQPGESQQEISSEEKTNRELKDVIQSQDIGLTPAEKVTRSNKRFDEGIKQYQDAGTKLRGMTRDKERLDILESLNKSKNLPKELGRLNVNKEGNLRVPFLASPEAQRYVKTLNEFSAGAKDTFGSRVTNFDLQQYLLRYPNLLNSEEGRRQLLQQMKIVNQINSIYYKNLKNVYDKAGGVRNIDSDVAERFAEQISDPQIKELQTKFNEIGNFPTLPDASQFKGKKMMNDETGEVMISDGTQWTPSR